VIGRRPYHFGFTDSTLFGSNIDTTAPVFRSARYTQSVSIESIGLFAEKPQAKILSANEFCRSICTEIRQFFRDPALPAGISLKLKELPHNPDFPAFVPISDSNGWMRKRIILRAARRKCRNTKTKKPVGHGFTRICADKPGLFPLRSRLFLPISVSQA
jgi:hypothetical protein